MSNIIKQIFKSFDFNGTADDLRQRLDKFEMPLNAPTEMLDYMLERSYLEEVSGRRNHEFQNLNNVSRLPISWIKIDRIPIHPSTAKEYDIMSKWQSVLSSIHAWGHRIFFMLKRTGGTSNIYIGIEAINLETGRAHLKSALINSMPGVEIHAIDLEENMSLIGDVLKYKAGGAVTGIPSLRENKESQLHQTLDQLAFGVRDSHDEDVDFSVIVIAEPMTDEETTEIIHRYQKLGSEIHSEVTAHVSDSTNFTKGESTSTSFSVHFGLGQILGSIFNVSSLLAQGFTLTPSAATLMGTALGFAKNYGSSKSTNVGRSIAKDYLNKFAQYTERMTDMHCERLRKGRNLGYWNVGVHILGYNDNDVNTVMGVLRSVYSGDQSYLEPIRLHTLNQSNAIDHLKSFQLIPLQLPNMSVDGHDEWHVLGKPYQYLATPMNTEELSLATSLPRKDVPGLRFVRSSVRFANNPGTSDSRDSLSMGHIIDSGIIQKNEYKMDINALVRHSLIVGSTGCGKTTTCKTIINDVLNHDIPVLIIEPAKDEYVRWAIEQNKVLPKDKQINIFMPGVKNLEPFGVKEGMRAIPQLKLNPFQPAAIEGAPIDMLTRCEQLTALINASLPTSDILPVLIDEAFFTYLVEKYGMDFTKGEMNQQADYPKMDGVLPIAQKLLKGRGYAPEVANGLSAALETRFNYLTRGKRGQVLNVFRSTPYDKLFNQTTVINLSKIANSKDKALIMSLLMLSLYEYRISAYMYDEEYRKKAQSNKLLHMTVVEEAHNVLTKPAIDAGGSGNPQQVVADLFGNMLSEIRSYGEGLMIIDQVPTRLISDSLRNTNFKIVHRLVAQEDCSVMSAALGLRSDQKDIIPLLSQGQVLISSDKDDAASWVKINKPKILL